eukprot:IDg10840t1
MDPEVLSGMELFVGWQSGVDPEAEAGLGKCLWGFDVAPSAVWGARQGYASWEKITIRTLRDLMYSVSGRCIEVVEKRG